MRVNGVIGVSECVRAWVRACVYLCVCVCVSIVLLGSDVYGLCVDVMMG